MKKNFFIIALLMGLTFSACTKKSPELSEQEKTQIENQILGEWEKICFGIENSDSEVYASFIDPDFIQMASNGSVFYSKEEYINKVRNWFSTRVNTEIQQEKIIVTALTEDIALLDQESDLLVTYKEGNVQRVHHAVSLVFEKEASGWMIIHGHESFIEIQ